MEYLHKYSNFSPDNFKYSKYLELIDSMMKVSGNEEDRKRIFSIMTEGGYDNNTINKASYLMNRNNPGIEARKRAGQAYLLSRYPDTFYELVRRDICLFHGTDSNALPSILTNGGLKSFGLLEKERIEINSGEASTRQYRTSQSSSDFVSITDDLETIYEYATGKRDKSSFGVVIGIELGALKNLRTIKVQSDCVELGIKEQIPLEMISFIGVKQDKVDFVKRLVGQRKIDVMPMPIEFDEKFYAIEPEGFIYTDHDKLERLINCDINKKKSFGIDSYKDLGQKISLGKMLDTLKKLVASKKKNRNEKSGIEIGDE